MGFYLHNVYLACNLFLFLLAKLLVQVLGARLLTPAFFGQFSYIYALIDIWNHLFGAGLDIAVPRTYKTREDWPELWKRAALLKAALGVLGSLFGFFLLPWPYSLLFALWHIFFMQ